MKTRSLIFVIFSLGKLFACSQILLETNSRTWACKTFLLLICDIFVIDGTSLEEMNNDSSTEYLERLGGVVKNRRRASKFVRAKRLLFYDCLFRLMEFDDMLEEGQFLKRLYNFGYGVTITIWKSNCRIFTWTLNRTVLFWCDIKRR